ncbi:MAG: glutamine--tRNA ligase/YqeY domain fusion protein [Bacteroidetes Order II. Incertae sedis bacterium]|nr:glutamine--tRNA ligase/YqeY domain fusion protein [Bacteroidetes Order II. bacterium]
MFENTLSKDFLRDIVGEDVTKKRYPTIITRFPPEPNGYLHIGHAKSIVLNFGIAADFHGRCHLRMDDTNPETEETEYVEKIIEMIQWLGYDWGTHLYFASDYFDQMYEYALTLIQKGVAYVDSQTDEEIRKNRGSLIEAGVESPYRNRSIAENHDLFIRMKDGEFPDGAHVLRAKGDMSSPNMKMRDPILYRIKHASHYRTGDKWCIYPLYDYAHPLSDAIEHVSHSFCTLEFDNNRAIYDWLMEHLWEAPRPYQYEFARMNLDYTIVSKRKLLQLVREKHVSGWDDPRMPTLAALRRRGFTPASIRTFAEKIGVAKTENRIDIALLEWAIRNDLNFSAPRRMAVLEPLKVVLTNWAENQTEVLQLQNFPPDVIEKGGGDDSVRELIFGKTLYIEREDFAENPPKGWKRLVPGGEVRLKGAYIIRCDEVIYDADGHVSEIRATYDPATKSGQDTTGKKATAIHWVSMATGIPATFRLYDRLFSVPNPEDGVDDFKQNLNPHSLVQLQGFVEPAMAYDPPETRWQLERQGYFWPDPVDSTPDHLVLNRIVTLRDSWEKQASSEKTIVKPKEKKATTKTTRAEASDAAKQLAQQYGIDLRQAEIIAHRLELTTLFSQTVDLGADATSVSAWVSNEANKILNDGQPLVLNPAHLFALIQLIANGIIGATTAKQVFLAVQASGKDPALVVEEQGLQQISDPDVILGFVQDTLAAFPEQLAQYKSGKTQLLGFFTGKVMQVSGGKAHAAILHRILTEALAS